MRFKTSKHKLVFGSIRLFCGLLLLSLLSQPAKAIGPPPAYTAIPTTGAAPLTVTFTGPSLDGSSNAISSWHWSFGDGVGTSAVQSPTYTYTNAGTFTPLLIVSNAIDHTSPATGPSITVAISWTNIAGGNWSVPGNWSPNQVPTATNSVLITIPGTYAVNLDVSAMVNGLTLGGAASGVQTLQSGSFALIATNAQIDSNGVFNLTNSAFSGALSIGNRGVLGLDNATLDAQITVGAGGLLSLEGDASALGDGSDNDTNYWLWVQSGGLVDSGVGLDLYSAMTNSGVVSVTNGNINIFNDGSIDYCGGLTNLPGGVIDLSNYAGITANYGSASLVNQGTINTSGGTSVIGLGLGLLEGNFNAAAGATVQFGGNSSPGTVPAPGLSLGGSGLFEFNSGVLVLTNDTIANLLYTGGTLVLGPAFQGGAVTNLSLDGSTFSNTLPVKGNLAVTNSTLQGSFVISNGAVFSLDNAFVDAQVVVASGGQMTLAGQTSDIGDGTSGDTNYWLSVQSGGTVSSMVGLDLYSIMTNSGLVNLTNYDINIYNDGTPGNNGGLYNLAGGVIDLWDFAGISTAYGFAYLVNQGTINAAGGTSAVYLGLGSLAGSLNAAAGATLQIGGNDNPATTPGPGLTLGGSGRIEFNSGLLLLTNDTIPNLLYTGGSLALGAGFQGGAITNLALDGITFSNTLPVKGALTVTNSTLQGSFVISNGAVFSLDNVTVDAQVTVGNGGQLALVDEASDLGDGFSHDTNYWLWVQSGGVVNSAAGLNLYSLMTNSGLVNLTNNSINIFNDGTPGYFGGLDNLAGGVIDLWDYAGVFTIYGSASLTNQGTINVAGGNSTIDLGLALLTGTYNAAVGTTISFAGNDSPGTMPGAGLTLSGGGQFEFDSGLLVLTNDTIPDLDYTGGTLALGASFQGGAITNLNLNGITLSNVLPLRGILNVTESKLQGAYVVTNGAVLSLDNATVDAQVTVLNGGQVSLVGDISYIGDGSSVASNYWLSVQGGGVVNSDVGLGLYAVMTNSGLVNLTNYNLYIYNDGTAADQGGLYNLPGGAIDLWNYAGITGDYGNDYLINQGAITGFTVNGDSGIFVDNFTNAATLSAQYGALVIGGTNVALQPSGTLAIALSGLNDYGSIDFETDANLDLSQAGSLVVTLNNGYVPSVSNVFQVLLYDSFSGSLASTNLPAGVPWQTAFGATSLILTVSPSEAPPTLQFSASVTNGSAPLTVQFFSPANDNNGNAILSWNWSFGDGNTSTNQNPTNTYTSAGTFTPDLIVTNVNNQAIIATGPSISVQSGFTVSVSASPPSAGSVGGGGTFGGGSLVTVTATASNGFQFANWTSNGVVESSSANYAFTLNASVALVASFVAGPPQIGLFNGSSPILPNQTNALNFGSVAQGQTGPVILLSVTNSGGQTLILTNMLFPPGFLLSTNSPGAITNFPYAIAAASNATFGVQLGTTSIGNPSGNVTIYNNDPSNSLFSFPVAGTVTGSVSQPPCLPPPPGLVGWWPANSNATDIIGENNGTLQGGVTFTNGEVGQAFSFDGSSGYVSVPNSPLWNFGTNEFTIEFWANFAGTNNTQSFIACDDGTNSQNKWVFFYGYAGSALTFHLNGTPGNLDIGNFPFSPAPGQWYHLALTRSNLDWTFYVNGSAIGTDTDTNTVPAVTAPLTIGNAEGNYYFDGALDEIAIFNVALSSNEVAALYAAGSAGMCAVGQPPAIVTAPTNQTVSPGNTVVFSLGATGTAPVTYQWLLDTTNLTDNAQISGSQSNILTITNVAPGNAGTYEVIVSNAYGSTNAFAVLTVVVAPSNPIVSWSPGTITYGTPLGSNQLNAAANVPGTFTYTPPAGTVFDSGAQTLAVLFTPSNTASFNSVTTNVNLVVARAPLSVTASNVVRLVGAANPVFGGTITGTNFADSISASYSCKATAGSPAGTYPITPALLDPNNRLSNYIVSIDIGTLTISAGVIVTSPANGQSFSAPANIAFAATASLPAGVRTFGLYTNSVLVTSSSASTAINTALNNLPGGSYLLTAVATDNNGNTFSQPVDITVNAPGTTLINFDPLDTSIGVMNGTPLSSYLAGFGVTISNVTFGTSLEAATGSEAISQSSISGSELPLPTSPPNLLTQVGSDQPVSFVFDFAGPLQSFGFSRVGLSATGNSSISHPAWTASILDASGDVLESVSEPLLFSSSNISTRTFTLVGSNIASVRFDSDSEGGTSAVGAVLLDNLLLGTNVTNNPLAISLAQPAGATAPASIVLSATATDSFTNIAYVAFYSGLALIGTVATPASGSNYSLTWTNVLNGTYSVTAKLVDAAGYALVSSVRTVTVLAGGNARVVNFDTGEAVANLAVYLSTNQLAVASNSAGTTVEAENASGVAGGGFVVASSPPNILTQNGSNGPVSFTVDFSNLLGQFSFTRPELLANPFVTHPAWQVQAFDELGQLLTVVNAPQISSATNVPAQTYTLDNPASGAGIASVAFNSEGSGLTTFNAMLLDDFVLETGSNLPPSIIISSPTNGQVFTNLSDIPLEAQTGPADGSITSVTYYSDGVFISNSTSPFSISWNAPSNGAYLLTAMASNSLGQSSTSAPVLINVATSGFAIVTPPTNQTVGLSNTATFGVTTSPANGVSFQWQFNGGAIAGATLSTYAVNNAQSAAAGSYTVVATLNGQSTTSQPPAVLTVLGPPAITSLQPGTNVVVLLGSNSTLSVTANDAGSGSFYYQWLRNGQFLAGATNASFTISNAQPAASGLYNVLVANAVASIESPDVNVSVNFLGTNAPATSNDLFASSIRINPTNGPVGGNNSGSPAVGELSTIAGKPAGKFLWFNWTAGFTGVISLSTLGSGFDTLLGVYAGSNVANLTTNAADDDSAGFFDSLVSFNCVQGTTYQIAVAGYRGASGSVVLFCPGFQLLDTNYLNVNVPVITQQPHSRIIQAGDTVSFLPGVSNASSYQWYFAGAPIAGANSVNLVISNVPASAAGNYYLRVANAVGSAESQTVSVQIQSAAQTTGTPTNLFTDKFGDAVDLTGGIVTERYQPEDAGGETGGFTLSQAFSTVGATKEEGEPDHAGQPGGASYWYSYTAPGNGTLQFNTTGSTFDTILAVYTGPGDSFSTLVNVGAAYATNYAQQGQPAVLVTNASTGTKYYIAIDGYLGASGAARLNIILNQATNAITSHEIVPLTNDNAVIFMTAPFDNFSTTKTSLTVRGVVRGLAGAQKPFVSSVQLGLNGNPIAQAALGASRYSATLTPEPGGTEGVVAQEGVPWSATVTLVPGANIITAQSFSVQGDNTQYVSRPVTHTVYLVTALPSRLAKSILTLVTSPSGYGKITGQPSQASLELNKVYSVKAVPTGNWIFTNWTSGTNINNLTPLQEEADLQFIMTSNLILQANFMSNPFTAVSGSYNGLFSPASGVTEESSGFFSATLPPAGRGAYSARLLLQGTAYPFSGVFDLSGNAQQTVNRSGDSPLTVDLHLSLTAPDDQLTGTVTDNGGDNWSSSLLASRAQSQLSTNYSGRYTVVFPPPNGDATNQPGGYGFATLTNNAAGHVSINGRLADNSHLSQYVSISKNGNIPLYVSLYSRQGLLLGWLTLTNLAGSSPAQTLFGSNLTWIKVGGAPGKYYASGFTNADVTVLGSHYAPPSSGSGNFNLTNATLTIGGGGMTGALVYSNLSLSGNKLSNIAAQGNPPVSLQGVISPSTGVLTLTFRPTGADSDIVAKGVILQDTNAASSSGAGWFLGADQSGFFLLQQ